MVSTPSNSFLGDLPNRRGVRELSRGEPSGGMFYCCGDTVGFAVWSLLSAYSRLVSGPGLLSAE
jgi:hypothetical protein